MRNQSSNNSVDKEINLQSSNTPQHSLAQCQQLKEQQNIRYKSNSSTQSNTLSKAPQLSNKNSLLKRPSSVNQRPRSTSKNNGLIQNEVSQNLSNAKNRSQDDSNTNNSLISSMSINQNIVQNIQELPMKPNQLQNQINSLHQSGYSMQQIKYPNQTNNVTGVLAQKVITSTQLQNSNVELNTYSQNVIASQQNQSKSCEEEQQIPSSINIQGNTFQIFSQRENQINQEAVGVKHSSSVDLPPADSQNNTQFQQKNNFSKQNKIQNQDISKSLRLKQQQKYEIEEGQDEYQTFENLDGLKKIISSQKRDMMNQLSINNQVNNSILGGNDSEKFELSNSSCSKFTSNSMTSRSQKNQSNTSDDSMQDSKQENLNSNSAIVSSSNNSSKIFKGSSNNSLILNQCTSKLPSSANPEKGNLNDIQSKEEIQESIKSLRNPKPRDSHILQNSRLPIKLMNPEDSKNQTLISDDTKPIISSAITSKPNLDVNESLIKQKHPKTSKLLQFMHRRGNTLSRSDIDELQFLELQKNILKKHSPEDEKIIQIFKLENKSQSEQLMSNSNKNQSQFVNQNQVTDIQLRNYEENILKDQFLFQDDKDLKQKSKNIFHDNSDLFQKDNKEQKQLNSDYSQEDKDEETCDIEIQKQLEIFNSDSEIEEQKFNTNEENQNNFEQYRTIFQPTIVGQQQHQTQFHPNVNPFLDISNANTPQLSTQQHQSYDSFTLSQSSSTPNQQQQNEFMSAKRQIGARTMSKDLQYSQFLVQQPQQSVMNNTEQCESSFQLLDNNLQDFSNQIYQQQQAYAMYDQTSHQQKLAMFGQQLNQSSPSMNTLVQFNQLHNQSPPVSQQQQQQNFQIYQQHPMQMMIQPNLNQYNIQKQQNTQQLPQQLQTNQININQQGQQPFYQKGQKQHLQLQSYSSFSSNSNSTYHLPKQNCNLSQASTADSDPINTFRSGSSFGNQDKQQEGILKSSQQQYQQLKQQQQQSLNQQQQAIQLSYQSQQMVQHQKNKQQQINDLNFFPNHPIQQDNKFFSQSNPQFVTDSYPSANNYGYSQIDPKQFQNSQQITFTQQDYLQNQLMQCQYQQAFIPQNNQQNISQNINQISPDKLNTVPHVFSNPSLLTNTDLSQIHNNSYQNQMNSYKPTHSKQQSCSQFGQFDQQNQTSLQSQQQNIQLQKQLQQQQNSTAYHIKNSFNNSMSQGSLMSNSSGNNLSNSANFANNSSQINLSNSNHPNIPKGKKKSEIRDEAEKNIIDLNKLEEDQRTSVYIQNIPNKYKLNYVLQTIDINHRDKYDFVYLPMDLTNNCNLGYAFVNFLKPEYIREFFLEFNGKKWKKFNSDKICDLKYARIQGREKYLEFFKDSIVMTLQEEQKPYFKQNINNEIIENQKQLQSNSHTQSQRDLYLINDNQSQNNNRNYRNQNSSIHSNQNNSINDDLNNNSINMNRNARNFYHTHINQQIYQANSNQNNSNSNNSNINYSNNNNNFNNNQNNFNNNSQNNYNNSQNNYNNNNQQNNINNSQNNLNNNSQNNQNNHRRNNGNNKNNSNKHQSNQHMKQNQNQNSNKQEQYVQKQ